ncbi:MAG: bis(5'-nucleosyl)-tetraphosphatase (symmetrical) YqeK [Tepidiformaceae bacterium]
MTLDVAAQIEAVRAEFATRPEGLQRHVDRVLVEALDLAQRYDIDPERATLAAWGHDLFRAHSPSELLVLSREAGMHIEPADEAQPVLLHGPLGAVVLRERFAVTDPEVLAAVRDHTLGLAEMSILAKIILIADKVEMRKRRRTPPMKAIRRLAWRDLDLALLCWSDWKWVEERMHEWASDRRQWHARQRWVAEHHDDVRFSAKVSGAVH